MYSEKECIKGKGSIVWTLRLSLLSPLLGDGKEKSYFLLASDLSVSDLSFFILAMSLFYFPLIYYVRKSPLLHR
jgi:hypothetical protein